jgi:hypothetical protein
MKFKISYAPNLMNAFLISIFISFLYIATKYFWLVNQYPSHVTNMYTAAEMLLTSIFAIIYAVYFIKFKKYFLKFSMLKSLFLTIILYIILHLTLHKLLNMKAFDNTVKDACLHNFDDTKFVINCISYYCIWFIISNLILWLQVPVLVEILEKIGVLNRDRSK